MVKILKMCTSKLWGTVLVLYHKNLFCLALLSAKIFSLGTLVQDRKKLLRLPKLQIVMILYKICHRYLFINKIFLAVLLLCIICVIYVLCLSCFCVCSLVSCGHLKRKSWPSWLLLVMFIVFLLLFHVVSWVRCGTWKYCFLIFSVFLTLNLVIFLKIVCVM